MMNFRAFVLLVFVYSAAGVSPRNRFQAGILKLIEKSNTGDVWSLPVSIPSLNPLRLPSMTVYRQEYTMAFSELGLYGLENMWVKSLYTDPSDFSMSIEFFVPTLTIYADQYYLQATFLIFPVNDVGVFICYVNNLNVRADVRFGRQGSDTVITGLNLYYSGDVQVYLSGSTNLVNNMAKLNIEEMMRDPRAVGRMENMVKERARQYLRGHTPREFIRIISNIQ